MGRALLVSVGCAKTWNLFYLAAHSHTHKHKLIVTHTQVGSREPLISRAHLSL